MAKYGVLLEDGYSNVYRVTSRHQRLAAARHAQRTMEMRLLSAERRKALGVGYHAHAIIVTFDEMGRSVRFPIPRDKYGNVDWELQDASNRVVARAGSKVAAHRATRKKKHAGSRVVTTTKMTTVERRTLNMAADANYYKVINYADSGYRIVDGPREVYSAGEAAEKARRTPHSSIDVMSDTGSVLRTMIFSPKHPVDEYTFDKLLMRDARNRAGTHRRTFTEARGDIIQFLRSEGWQVKSDLKYPHAISRDGRTHLYFKPQAVYVGSGGGMGNTRSMWVDIRDVDGPAFLRAVESWAA